MEHCGLPILDYTTDVSAVPLAHASCSACLFDSVKRTHADDHHSPLASSIFAPGVPDVIAEFNSTDETLATFVVSVFVLGFAFGPLLVAPLSEIYGRNPVYHVCNVLFVVFTVGCALSKNMGMLIAFRFLSGFAGVAAPTIGAGSIADMVSAERRGKAMSIWSMGPMLGPSIGPVIAGFVIESLGWRWAFWIVVIAVSRTGQYFVKPRGSA